jgi:hypothetical protein
MGDSRRAQIVNEIVRLSEFLSNYDTEPGLGSNWEACYLGIDERKPGCTAEARSL